MAEPIGVAPGGDGGDPTSAPAEPEPVTDPPAAVSTSGDGTEPGSAAAGEPDAAEPSASPTKGEASEDGATLETSTTGETADETDPES